MKNEKTGKIKTVRGSVLFTTVSVMALLIIFLTGALALASSANNRAHKSYASSQASYNARAAIDSFTQAMINDAGIAAAVHDMGTNGLQPKLTIGGGDWTKDSSNGWGTIGYYDSTGEFVEGYIDIRPTNNTGEYAWDPKGGKDEKGEWVKLTEFKITATAKYGREEETVTAYLKTQIKEEEDVTVVKGLQSLGKVDTGSSSIIYSGLGLGLNLSGNAAKDQVYDYTSARYATRTELSYINGSIKINTSNAELGVYTNKSKTVIMGNMQMNNNDDFIFVDYDASKVQTQQDVPLLFVNGLLDICAKQFVTDLSKAKASNPFNIFAGTINLADCPFQIGSADLYLMDSVDGRSYAFAGKNISHGKNVISGNGDTNQSQLYKWTSNIEGKNGYENTEGGNIFCKGDLDLSKCTINGDVRVEGNCTISGDTTITGRLVVGGSLTISGDKNNISPSNVYYGVGCNWDKKALANKIGSSIKAGYTPVNNIPNYYAFVVDTKMPDNSGYQGAKGENLSWNNGSIQYSTNDVVVYYRYDTQFDPNWTPEQQIEHIDGDFGCKLSPDELGISMWIDGREGKTMNLLENQSDGEITYYDSTNNRVVPQSSALDLTGFPEGITAIYPTNMTRENIYGEDVFDEEEGRPLFEAAPSETKLITTIQEARKALGLDPSSGEASKAQYDAMTLLANKQLTKKNAEGKDEVDLDKFQKYGEGYTAVTNKMEISGYNNYYFKGDITGDNNDYTATIKTGSKDVNVILDNVTINQGTKLIVDTTGDAGGGKGNITFYVLGNLNINKGEITHIDVDKQNAVVNYKDDFGITFYGVGGSKINFDDSQSRLVGSFKMPYTKFIVGNISPSGEHSVDYTDEYKNKVNKYKETANDENRAHMIGNGIFEEAKTPNDFVLIYTETGNKAGAGNGSRTLFSATNDIYELSYYAAS